MHTNTSLCLCTYSLIQSMISCKKIKLIALYCILMFLCRLDVVLSFLIDRVDTISQAESSLFVWVFKLTCMHPYVDNTLADSVYELLSQKQRNNNEFLKPTDLLERKLPRPEPKLDRAYEMSKASTRACLLLSKLFSQFIYVCALSFGFDLETQLHDSKSP